MVISRIKHTVLHFMISVIHFGVNFLVYSVTVFRTMHARIVSSPTTTPVGLNLTRGKSSSGFTLN